MQYWEKPFYNLCSARNEEFDKLWKLADVQAQKMTSGTFKGEYIHLVIESSGKTCSWHCNFAYNSREEEDEFWLAS